jgi:CRP-like cAMP-binding protein
MALDDTIGLFQQAPIVGLFEREALRLLAFSAEPRRLRAGEILFRQGDRSDGGYVVSAGRIGISARTTSEGGGVPDVVAGPGALIGRVALFVRTKRPATATALAPSEVLRISPTLLRRVLTEFPTAAEGMRDAIAEELLEMSADLERVRSRMLNIGRR